MSAHAPEPAALTLHGDALPTGPPLHLEQPGSATRHLSAFIAPSRLARLEEVLDQRVRHIAVLLEHVHDPHNIAACVRSCDAFGLQDLHIVPTPGKNVRLSRHVAGGAQRWVTTHEHASLDAALAHLRARGYRIAATDLGGLGGAAPPTPITQVSLERPLCVAFGNEHDGISEALRRACDERVFIPMAGFVESFNVSVACAVTLAELRRRHVATHGPRGDLAPEARQRLLDQWVVEDIPKARQVIAELARRATLPGPSASD